MKRRSFRLGFLSCTLLFLGCFFPTHLAPADAPNPADLDISSSEMRSFIERYAVDLGSINRSLPSANSLVRRARLKKLYSDWRERLNTLDFDSMGQSGRADYILLRNRLEHELRDLEVQSRNFSETLSVLPFAQTILELEDARRRMDPIDSPGAAASLTRLYKQIEETRKAVEAGLAPESKVESAAAAKKKENAGAPIKVKKTLANRAARTVDGLRSTLKSWFEFFNGYDPVFTWWVGEPYKGVDQALQSYAAFIREKIIGLKPGDNTAIIGDPIGRDALLAELEYEMIPYTPEQLVEMANKEFEWCEQEMKRASRDLGYGDEWKKALEHVKQLHVEPGRQPGLIRELALEGIEFVDRHDLMTVPPLARETWRMEMMTPDQQLANPFFLGGETIRVSFPTNTMGHEQKMMSMRGNNIHFSRATVFHELIPGHHLQGFMTSRYRPYRSVFSTPFWGEGWALYCEMLFWDLNFPKSPENRIGMLFWRMHRCARILFSLGFHLERMTPEECIDLLVKRVGHEPENASAEVRRSFSGSYGPLYQSAYMLGGLQFRALHRELVGSGKMTNRAFHDAILKENRIPVEMVRVILTAQKISQDFKPSWKFYPIGARP